MQARQRRRSMNKERETDNRRKIRKREDAAVCVVAKEREGRRGRMQGRYRKKGQGRTRVQSNEWVY
jgi:hypothetical protein